MSNEFDYSEFDKFADELVKKVPDVALQSAIPAMEVATDYLIGIMPDYPEETLERLLPSDGVSFLRTEQQRKWFFAATKAGEVPGWQWVDGGPKKVGGARTGNLQRALTRDVTQSDDAITGTVGFDKVLAPYAPWVVGDVYPGSSNMPLYKGGSMYQASVHIDRWWQFNQQINENIDRAWEVFKNEFWTHFHNVVINRTI